MPDAPSFEWDDAKDRANRIKHGVSFVEATMTMGLLSPHCNVAEVASDQGEAAVRSSKRVAAQ